MKTFSPKLEEVDKNRKWYLVDAKDKTLGRIATKIAVILRGKNKPTFSPHIDCGDHVIVINADQIRLSGQKWEQKKYYTHSGYPGALKTRTAKEIKEKKPEYMLEEAVKGMIPRNRLRTHVLSKLKIYAGEDHKHTAQNPEKIDL
ncbi:50S ribosomal protein L13 [Candidatus Peregrinibacteria bacterium CG22_combo_CG10-13_8_21_14_all_44_10]|nr:MAG: 50S ribosomal protein L13 [Candidatus Peregrinibacteria bacterium CG2_30_44_17]PIP66079.1 MAG: 50S ribosomal protein L13 [Candidatus Peregrinibacteria bacterium CG22_combo_CG10-13_8_21_14_all_44_10]PIS03605.1 MAG: 50S ribosomal protein L13 [Candidatus Peregrinibacteria bacterium CG10_big_fil_rev_8_21_14_0_10_44_7]PIX78867.1 MAG: 50S ribosomal protein L13 [Candidatus Peregrinibacteria bacterium CG_4_10_14_3_um_filter_44_21]PJB88882.1 MAG: 50S ribosomal protein L13 [Candidatus Peregriniba